MAFKLLYLFVHRLWDVSLFFKLLTRNCTSKWLSQAFSAKNRSTAKLNNCCLLFISMILFYIFRRPVIYLLTIVLCIQTLEAIIRWSCPRNGNCSVIKWRQENCILINTIKAAYMLITTRQKLFPGLEPFEYL